MAPSRARELRKSMTPHEVKLWLRLRALRTIGYHFRRQSPLAPYVVDFECRQARLVIEVDGDQHGFDEHRQRDAVRDQALERRGYKVLRFSNGEVTREIDGVMEAIYLALKNPHPATRHSASQEARERAYGEWPPSPGGEG
jgi:very-short-patch-repair endonuclease